MSKITNELVEKSFEVGKAFFKNKLTLAETKTILTKMGMNENSAIGYAYYYSHLIQGKLFTRTTNGYATEYFLKNIYKEDGIKGLQNALLSLSQHIDYYESKSGSLVKKRKEIYLEYLRLIDGIDDSSIYPNEVDETNTYAEGKVKQVLVNSYERNPVARKKCIEHYGLNCQVCDFNFKDAYGDLGKDFIHVHHVVDIATIGNEYSINPIKELIPVCPNCHAMLHKKKPAFSINELKKQITR
jgi:5-methylcytosine-specific restriction protein A